MKKLLSLALISAMLLTFTACDKKENSSDTSTENSQSNQTSNSEPSSTNSEPVSASGSGWTAETAASVFCIDGKPIPYPFTIDALGSDYSIKKSDTEISDSGFCSTNLYHGKDKIFILTYNNIKKYDDISSATPKSISTYYEGMDDLIIPVQQLISFNGIRLGASKEEVSSAFGEPNNDKSDPRWTYKDSNSEGNCILFSFNSDEKVNFMRISFNS